MARTVLAVAGVFLALLLFSMGRPMQETAGRRLIFQGNLIRPGMEILRAIG